MWQCIKTYVYVFQLRGYIINPSTSFSLKTPGILVPVPCQERQYCDRLALYIIHSSGFGSSLILASNLKFPFYFFFIAFHRHSWSRVRSNTRPPHDSKNLLICLAHEWEPVSGNLSASLPTNGQNVYKKINNTIKYVYRAIPLQPLLKLSIYKSKGPWLEGT